MTPPPSKSVTLEDIARIAGVHRRTVGDALQGTGRVASATRENVLRIARELHYEPNLIARALATGKTGRIAILIGSLDEPYNMTVVRHLVSFLTKHGYEAMILQAHLNLPSAQTLRSSFADGMIVVGMHFIDSSVRTHGVIRDGTGDPILPYVVLDARCPQHMDHIQLDLGEAVHEVLQVMISSGRPRIAYLNKHTLEPDNPEVRFRAYMDEMKAAGHEPEIIIADECLPSQERIQQLKEYFEQHGAPGALFCHNDEIAVFAYRALRDLGYRIPSDALAWTTSPTSTRP
jgi:DNA-binding LacI/PurR family transcriptional regulator